MIFDKQNMFFDAAALSKTPVSDIVRIGEGEASDPLTLHVSVANAKDNATYTVKLKTAKTVSSAGALESPVVLGTYTAMPLNVKVPRGNLGYLQIEVTTDDKQGAITAGLVMEDDVR